MEITMDICAVILNKKIIQKNRKIAFQKGIMDHLQNVERAST
jgi:hypothetical protein